MNTDRKRYTVQTVPPSSLTQEECNQRYITRAMHENAQKFG